MKKHPFLSGLREFLSLLWVLTHFIIICLLLITWLPAPLGIGLIVALSAWLIVNAILVGLGAKELGSLE